MRVVKKCVLAAGLVVIVVLAASRPSCSPVGPQVGAARPSGQTPAQSDLAEAVYSMVAARAAEAGLPQPVTLCQACVAAHLGLPDTVVRGRCRQACGLGDRVSNEQQ